MEKSLSWQTIAPHCNGVLCLSGNDTRESVVSPYFQMADLREEAPGRNIPNILDLMTIAYILGYEPNGTIAAVNFLVKDNVGSNNFCTQVSVSVSIGDSDATIEAAAIASVNSFCLTEFAFTPDVTKWLVTSAEDVAAAIAAAIPPAPSSYQTIVSQTGTTAPAVSGSLTPASTYPAGTTFTWARTGAGVYTLTASTAVFNTSGKTGVFVGTLNNLNASCKAVVTSSTVITLTTAIGSLLGLGLLGLTATNTDALLSQTMVYVQTYA